MGVIASDAARADYARQQADKADWLKAHEIAGFKTKESRTDALDKAARCEQSGLIDDEYREFLKGRASQILAKRRAEAEALAAKASKKYRGVFGQGAAA